MTKITKIDPVLAGQFDYIDIERTFHELSKYASEDDSNDISQVFHIGDQLSWADLTKEFRVVILAEAGSGKTAEIRHTAQALFKDGKPAFFLRLENIPAAFELAFEADAGSHADFQAWRDGNEEGWIFLDSVDEAKLRHPKDFELAITKLGHELGSAKDRAHILLTGRTTAWRPKSDLAHCLRHLPYGALVVTRETGAPDENTTEATSLTESATRSNENAGFKIVTLDDLNRLQIEAFLDAKGITGPKEFLDAVERADAWSFTARPQDLEELIAFWLRERRIGSRFEIMVGSIDRRLTERDQSRAEVYPLARDVSLIGAKLLAAATTLSKETNIQVPDGTANAAGISVGAVLPDWDERKQRTLLERPIFDEVLYDQVRFHHRSVREYLAAAWFADLLARDASRRQIEAMFFREQYGLTIVTPTLRPVLPWLILMDERIRRRVLQIAPEIALEGGDPSRLPLEDRRRILRDVCAQIAAGTSQRSTHNYSAVQRFAATDLAPDICALLEEHENNDELVAFLLRMVWLGQIREALPAVLRIALAPSGHGYGRLTAFRALHTVGTAQDQENVRSSFVAEGENLDRELLAQLVEHLSPTPEDLRWLLEAIARSAAKERYSVDQLIDEISGFVNRAPSELVPHIVSGLLPLLKQPPVHERHHHEISQRFGWLLVPASKAVERLIRERHPAALLPDTFEVLRMVSVARLFQSEDFHHEKTDFGSLVAGWPELNKALFWYEIEQARGRLEEGRRIVDYWSTTVLGPLWSFGEGDFEYACDEIANRSDQDNKLVALSVAFDLYRRFGKPRAWREKLKRLTQGNSELEERLRTFLRPPPMPEQTRWKARERRWQKQREVQEAKTAKYHAEWKSYLDENLAKLTETQQATPGEGINAIWYLLDRTREDERLSRTRWTKYNWQNLIPEYGEPVARFFRNTAVTFWRHYRPQLRSEGAPDNQTTRGTILGLTGLEIEFHETPGWPTGLSDAEVELACRHASFELNGFPVWFTRLFALYPDIVGSFLMREIAYEVEVDTPGVDRNYILSDVSWSGDWSWDWLGPRLIDFLRDHEPVNINTLGKLQKILQGSSLSDEELTALASQKCSAGGDNLQIALWFAVWTGVDPVAAIPALSACLDSILDRERRVEFAMTYVTHLSAGRSSEHGAARPAFHTPSHLRTLYILINRHVRREDDIERAGGGVYSPGLRDNAQDARNGLMEILLRQTGKEAYLALRDVAEAFPDRPWFLRLAKEAAERDGDLDPLTPQAIRELNQNLERTPASHRELAELAEFRLMDLKDELENGDTSIASILRTVPLETDMRKYIGKELRDKAQGRYVIPQEEELADARKPDLRFHGVGFDKPVPAELKLADKWSGNALLERLENQLCGDYLRDNRSSRGLLILVWQGTKQEWELPDGQRVDFNGLIAALQNRWEELSPRFPGIDDVKVIGIDLTRREQ